MGGDRLIGCIQAGHEDDTALVPEILLENLASRASGVLAKGSLFLGRMTQLSDGISFILERNGGA